MSPSRVSYGMSVVMFLKKTDRVMTTGYIRLPPSFQCIRKRFPYDILGNAIYFPIGEERPILDTSQDPSVSYMSLL